MNLLEKLKKHTIVVADTGEIDVIKQYKPVDVTTNPSLILKAAKLKQYRPLIDDAIAYGTSRGIPHSFPLVMLKACVNFGAEILRFIPGRISIEVNPFLSFDVEGIITEARHYIALCNEVDIDRERILIKLPATWEGIVAAKQLEKEKVHCNMTLLFNLIQASACAEAGVTLISPFVGRILDWHKKSEEKSSNLSDEDPGIVACTQIFNYYKKFGYKTQVMGASFRNIDEICALAGIDFMTLSPKFLKELAKTEGHLSKRLSADRAVATDFQKIVFDEKSFRWMMNQDSMATEKLAEGIRNFAQDIQEFTKLIKKELSTVN